MYIPTSTTMQARIKELKESLIKKGSFNSYFLCRNYGDNIMSEIILKPCIPILELIYDFNYYSNIKDNIYLSNVIRDTARNSNSKNI